MAADFATLTGNGKLPSTQVLRYGAVTFGPFVVTSVKVTPVYDSTGRTVVYSLFVLTVRAILGGSSTDAAMLAARRTLTTPGLPLYYTGQGFGGMIVNVRGGTDVLWGPKPQMLSFKPLGGGNGCEIEWSVEVAAPDCADAVFRGSIMEMAFKLTFEQSQGYSTRRMQGYFKIPSVRSGADGRRVGDTPDNYLLYVLPPLVPGFERTFGPRTIDEAKTRVDFEVVDTELGPNTPPVHCVSVEASAESSTQNMGFLQWAGTISARYELARTAPNAYLPVNHFLKVLVKDRTAAAVPYVKGGVSEILPLAFRMSEPSIYGRRVAAFQFAYSYTLTKKSDAVAASGLWRPVPGSNWREWVASLANTALSPYGQARMGFLPNDDKIIDLCRPGIPGVPYSVPPPARAIVAELVAGLFPPPSAQNSWLHWESELYIETDSGAAPLRTLPAKPLMGAVDLFGAVPDMIAPGAPINALDPSLGTGAVGVFNPPGPGGVLDPRQPPAGLLSAERRVRPLVILYLRGRAARAGFPVPAPRLTRIGKVEPIPANRLDRGEGFWQKQGFNAATTVVYHARWNLRYALPELPAGPIPVPPNPLLDPTRG